MRFDKPIKAKYNKEENKVSVSVSLDEDVVITKKISVDDFRQIIAELNGVIYEIDNK